MASAATGPTDVRYDCEPGGGDAAEVTKGRGAAIHSGAAGGDRPLRGRDRRSPRSRAPPDVRIPVRLLARAYAGRRLPTRPFWVFYSDAPAGHGRLPCLIEPGDRIR